MLNREVTSMMPVLVSQPAQSLVQIRVLAFAHGRVSANR